MFASRTNILLSCARCFLFAIFIVRPSWHCLFCATRNVFPVLACVACGMEKGRKKKLPNERPPPRGSVASRTRSQVNSFRKQPFREQLELVDSDADDSGSDSGSDLS